MDKTKCNISYTCSISYMLYERFTIFDTKNLLSRWYSDTTTIGSVPQGRITASTFYPPLLIDKANSSAITDCFLSQLTAAFHHCCSFLHNCDQLSCHTKWRAFYFFLFFVPSKSCCGSIMEIDLRELRDKVSSITFKVRTQV